MPSHMSGQLQRDLALTRRSAAPWRQVVILERLARAAGTVRWYFARSRPELEQVFERVRGGSAVSFYFGTHMHVGVDDDVMRQLMFQEITSHGELVLGYPSDDDVEFDVELISGPSELTEYLMFHPEGAVAVWGRWPPRANDGEDGITLDLVDSDGVLRQHPH